MATALVLGAGMVGSVIARDLAAEFTVTIADRSAAALAKAAARCPGLRTIEADLSDPATITALASQHDVVCGALASHLGFGALQAVIAAGKPYCDISFMPQDAWTVDELARAAGVTAVVDCGVAPGMSNLLSGWATARLDVTDTITIMVGGIPVERRWPWDYKAGFAPADVIEEYTRPSRIVENGKMVVREALSELERIDFDGVGTLEVFNTDGLRSLAYTLGGLEVDGVRAPASFVGDRPPVPQMKEKTMRWPGHVEKMAMLRHLGLFGTEPIEVGGVMVKPRDLVAKLLFPQWTYEDGEQDLTVMRVEATGTREGKRVHLAWDLYDRYDTATQATSMSRTTAFPCAIVARMLASGALHQPGVIVPERLGQIAGIPEALIDGLRARGIHYSERETIT
jgi:lysine 6-dehydrogenase